MRHLSRILLALTVVSLLAAVWAPGTWWQWGATALVLLAAGAGTGAAADRVRHPIDGPELMPEHVAREFVPPAAAEQIDQDVEEYKRREYGKRADER